MARRGGAALSILTRRASAARGLPGAAGGRATWHRAIERRMEIDADAAPCLLVAAPLLQPPLLLAACATAAAPSDRAADRLRARQRRHRRAVDDDDLALRERTAGRATACTRSTCPTRSRATTTTKPQHGRSSTAEHMRFLAAEVDKVLQATGADKVVLYRQLARRQRDPQLHRRTAAARARSRIAVLGGVAEPRRLGRPDVPARAASSTAPARS